MKYLNYFTNRLNSISENNYIILLVVLVFLTCLIRCFHGIDMTDSGWVLTGYQQIFDNPDSVESMFYIYDTLILGGIWESCFGFFGITGYKILTALFYVGIAILVYIILRREVNRWIILLGTILLITTNRYLVFHYDVASAFFSLLAVFFIYKSLMTRKIWMIFIAGFVLGVSVFVRFPNVALAGLILILLPFYLITKDTTLTWRMLLYAILGFLTGLVANALLLITLGHMDNMTNMCGIMFSFLSTSDSTHNLPYMLHSYQLSYMHILKAAYPLLFYPLLCYCIEKYETRKWLKTTLLILINIVFCAVLYKSYMRNDIDTTHAMCSIVLLSVLIRRDMYEPKTLYLAVLSFLIMFLFPLGSDMGIYNVGGNCLFIAFPLSVGLTWEQLKRYNCQCGEYLRYAMIGMACILLYAMTCENMSNSRRDNGSIKQKTSLVTNAKVYTAYTNPEKAAVIESLLTHVNPYIAEDTEMLAYPSIPMINYLTHTKPYLNGAWVGILNLETYKHYFQEAERTKPLPIIVIAKAPDTDWFYQNEKWLSITDCEDWHPSIKEKNEILISFISRHSYDITYDNEWFQVLIPVQ